MTNIFDKFLELMKSFEMNGVEYILIGGLAINVHGFARNTEDIDLFVNPSELNILRLQKSLFEIFEDNEIEEITSDELKKYAVIRFGTEYNFCIDIISRIGEQFSYNDLKYDIKKIDDVNIRVADLQTLYRLKENTFREIDLLDLKFLKSKINNAY